VAWWAWDKKSAFGRPHAAAMQRIRPYGNAAGRRPQRQPASREKSVLTAQKERGQALAWLIWSVLTFDREERCLLSSVCCVLFPPRKILTAKTKTAEERANYN